MERVNAPAEPMRLTKKEIKKLGYIPAELVWVPKSDGRLWPFVVVEID